MKTCELCKSPAKVYCDSDQASLCWTCDSKVHSANFLVARHSRSLLCRVCRSPTPWTAAGDKLEPSAVSICDKCVVDGTSDDDDDDVGDDEYDGDDDGETELDVADEDDNQVVPLSYTPPPPASSSSSDNEFSGERGGYFKRKREEQADIFEEEVDCLTVQKNCRVDTNGAVKGNGGTLYHFLPLNSEAMGEKVEINGPGAVTGECKGIRSVGLDLNSSDLDS